jgi:hypothetical protein
MKSISGNEENINGNEERKQYGEKVSKMAIMI